MVQIIEKRILSGSTDGRMINISGTATGSANTIHTAVSGTAAYDEIWLYPVNTSGSDVTLNIEYGGTNSEDNIEVLLPGNGVSSTDGVNNRVPGLLLRNSLVVTAFASVANVISIAGYVNRITD